MAARRYFRRQRGVALMVFLILVVIGGLAYLLANLSPEEMKARRDRQTQEVLAYARDALLGYAVQYRETQIATGQLDRVYGYLPLPDLGSTRNNNAGCAAEGCDAAYFGGMPFDGNGMPPTVVGRFPWKALGTEPLRDGYGECLWLIVSSSHGRIHRTSPPATPPPMNWDTLSQLDVVIANGAAALASKLASAHDRPVAIIFSPGPPLPGQDRSPPTSPPPTGDDVTTCGGNYDAANYLDPGTAGALGATSNYFPGAAFNNAFGATASASPKGLSADGVVERRDDGTLWPAACPQGGTCSAAANDRGLPLSGDGLFAALRKSSNFRLDINSMLDRMATCLRDQIAAGTFATAAIGGYSTPTDKNAGRLAANACYDDSKDPRGYFGNYAELVFVAKPNAGSFNVNVDGAGQSCAGVLVFGNQRSASQPRVTASDRNALASYLEGSNLTSFSVVGTDFAGAGQFARVSGAQTAFQDIVRCIPAGPSLSAAPSALPGGSELVSYDPGTRTLTLGRQDIDTGHGYGAALLFGCAWTPEAHATGSGVRAYFKFRITDTGTPGEGFAFAAIDGDRNGTDACGAARQHLGYSGRNGYTSPVAYPKVGIEFDTRLNYRDYTSYPGIPYWGYTFTDPRGFFPPYEFSSPASASHLNNGRADPNYTGGHMGVVYWGGETPISTGQSCGSGCTAPQFCSGGVCYLNPEEDDNVHGRTASPPATRPPPQNPVAPVAVPAPPAGVYKLDPSLSQVPLEQDIHVRVEIERYGNFGRDDHARRIRAVSTSNLATLAGLQTVDSVALADGNRVLLVGQTDARENGVWLARAGTWVRAPTEDEGVDLPLGSGWFVAEGGVNRGTLWRLENPDPVVVGISPLSITLFRRPVRAVATSNLSLTGRPTIDGITLEPGDRILLVAQSAAAENGVYDVADGAWVRSAFESTPAGMKAGATWYVAEGSSYWHIEADASPGAGAPIAVTRVDTTPNTIYFATLKTQVWKLADSVTTAAQIDKMKLTSRALSLLDPTHQPLLSDTKIIYDLRDTTAPNCAATLACPSAGQFCGIDNYCYSPAFRTMRLGFTNAQSTRDQIITITDFATTWLP